MRRHVGQGRPSGCSVHGVCSRAARNPHSGTPGKPPRVPLGVVARASLTGGRSDCGRAPGPAGRRGAGLWEGGGLLWCLCRVQRESCLSATEMKATGKRRHRHRLTLAWLKGKNKKEARCSRRLRLGLLPSSRPLSERALAVSV